MGLGTGQRSYRRTRTGNCSIMGGENRDCPSDGERETAPTEGTRGVGVSKITLSTGQPLRRSLTDWVILLTHSGTGPEGSDPERFGATGRSILAHRRVKLLA